MMRAYFLYGLSLGIHTVLLYQLASSQCFRRNPVFLVWLLCALVGQFPLLVLYWAREYGAYERTLDAYDGIWYALLAAAILVSFVYRNETVNQIFLRGAIGLLVCNLAARGGAHLPLTGGLGVAASDAINFSVLVPVSNMVWKLSGLRMDMLPLWVREISNLKFEMADGLASAAVGVARSILS